MEVRSLSLLASACFARGGRIFFFTWAKWDDRLYSFRVTTYYISKQTLTNFLLHTYTILDEVWEPLFPIRM
jgi:hypothetical protein